jgi:hypothetical protein
MSATAVVKAIFGLLDKDKLSAIWSYIKERLSSDLLWRIGCGLLLGAILVYCILRGAGYDLWDAVFPPLPDLSGTWEYRCTATQGRFEHGGYQHGGTVRIDQMPARFGHSIYIEGDRIWSYEAPGAPRRTFAARTQWRSQRGSFTGMNAIMFSYATVGTHVLWGCVECGFQKENGKVRELKGSFFYQVPSQSPEAVGDQQRGVASNYQIMWGTVEMRKMDGPNDIKWGAEH